MNTHQNQVSTTETTLESNHETEAVDVSTVEAVSTVAETNANPVKKPRARRKNEQVIEDMLESLELYQDYKLMDDKNERERFLVDLVNIVGPAVIKGDVHCDNKEVMHRIMTLSLFKKEIDKMIVTSKNT